jgi:hypothetical protein
MKDPISRSLDLLAAGLRPFVAARVTTVLRNSELAGDVAGWDAQGLLVFMWQRWNDLFRTELSFVERSLVSELRDFRNRWAHQDQLCEKDIYRILDGIERLLHAVNSPEQRTVAELRKESLNRLWSEELSDSKRSRFIRFLWPHLLCASSAIAIGAALLTFFSPPWSWILSLLVLLATTRIAWMQSVREAWQGPGPRECSSCGRIIYSIGCPYCNRLNHDYAERSKDGKSTGQLMVGSWTAFRLSAESQLAEDRLHSAHMRSAEENQAQFSQTENQG